MHSFSSFFSSGLLFSSSYCQRILLVDKRSKQYMAGFTCQSSPSFHYYPLSQTCLKQGNTAKPAHYDPTGLSFTSPRLHTHNVPGILATACFSSLLQSSACASSFDTERSRYHSNRCLDILILFNAKSWNIPTTRKNASGSSLSLLLFSHIETFQTDSLRMFFPSPSAHFLVIIQEL